MLLCKIVTFLVLCQSVIHVIGNIQLESDTVDWLSADQLCTRNHGNLATHITIDDVTEISELMRQADVREVWIGANQSETSWTWGNREDLDVDGFSAWDGLDVPSVNGTLTCVAAVKDTSSAYQWKPRTCNTQHGFVCQYAFNSEHCTNSDSTVHIDDKCFVVQLAEVTWYSARDYCTERGGDLAVFHGDDAQREYTQVVSQTVDSLTHGAPVWFGLASNFWHWTNGDDVIVDYWLSDQPSGSGRCLQFVYFSSNTYRWQDADCSSEAAVICRQDSVSTVENTSPIGEEPDGSEVTSLAPAPNDKPDDKKKSNASLTAGLVFLCLLLLLVFGGILVLFMCYIRRGRRLREKARLRNASTHGSINNGYVNPSYNHVNECTNINPQQPASSNGVGPEKTPRPSPLDMFAAAGRGIRSPDGVTMYNERCVDGASAGTAEKEQQAMEIYARGKDGPASKYEVEHEVSTVRSEGEAVLVGTRSYGDPSPSQSADVSQHSSRGHRSDESFHSRTYELPPTDGDRDDDKRRKRHSRSRGNPHGDGSMRKPRDRSRSRNREKQFGSHGSLRNIDDARPRSVKRHVRSHSVDDNLDGNFDEFTNTPLKEKDRKMSVGHGSMMSLRHLDDLYGDDDAFAVVDVSSNRRKSLVIGSQASLQVAAADDCVEYDSDAEKRRKEKRRLKKEKQRQKRMNASLPSLRGFNLEASENDRYLATDRSHGSSRRHDPEDPRHSDRSERCTSDLTRTPRSSRRGEVERPESGRRASVGKLDPIGTPRGSRKNYHRDQEDGGRPPHHDVRSLRTRSNSLSSNPLKDNQSNSSRGYGNFFEDDQHESHQRRRHRVKDRRASDSSRASLRDRDFESDGTEEQDHRVSRRDSRKQSRNSFHRSASHDGTLDNSRDDRRPKSAKGRNSKSNDDTSALRRSGSKRMLIRNSSQDSFSSGVGQDAQDDNFPPLVRRGSTASLIKVRPIPDHKLEPKLSAPPKEFDNKDGIPTVDILRLTSDSLSDAEKVTDHKDTMVDSGAWSTVKKATAEQSLDELVESYTRVATDEMAFEIASARNTGREENDMNIMSIDFSNEEVFEV